MKEFHQVQMLFEHMQAVFVCPWRASFGLEVHG